MADAAAPQLVDLLVEKPAAGGRMLARHEGRVILVAGAIPGERVRARIERTAKGMAFAEVIEVIEASPDRRAVPADWRCGGNAYLHVVPERQPALKAAIIDDAFRRIGRLPLAHPPTVIASPERGYRMRSRLHVRGARVGFYREGTNELCDPGSTGQLLPATTEWIAQVAAVLATRDLRGLVAIEIAENVSGDERACHLDLEPGSDAAAFTPLGDGLIGLSASAPGAPRADVLQGSPVIGDTLHARAGDRTTALRLHRHVQAFFQGNRFLLEAFAQHMVALVPPGPVVDLYAGVGLFGLSLLAAGSERAVLVEGDSIGGADLVANAAPFGARAQVERCSVEQFLDSRGVRARLGSATVVIDPPRTGVSRDALARLIAAAPPRIVYVSCDPATLARDARQLVDAGYEPGALTGFDLFPNTAHVETVAVFAK